MDKWPKNLTNVFIKRFFDRLFIIVNETFFDRLNDYRYIFLSNYFYEKLVNLIFLALNKIVFSNDSLSWSRNTRIQNLCKQIVHFNQC
jgi:hypothetical protein